MGGRIVSVSPTKFEMNEKLCPECAAATGSPCIRQSWEGPRKGNRPETHRSQAARLKVEFPFTKEFVAQARKRNARRR